MTPEHRMSSLPRLRPGRHAGFTLVELIIVMVVAAILTAIAIPMYLHQVRESRRTDARSAVLDLAGREERYFATNNAYTNNAALLGYSGWGSGNPVGSGYYYLKQPSVPASSSYDPNAANLTAPSYSITVLPVATSTQAADTTCASFTVDSAGYQSAENSGGTDESSTCWGQ